MKLGVFGRGRLGGAIARLAGDAVSWQVGRDARHAELSTVDVLVDVSSGAAVGEHVAFALERRTPLVIGTTGWTMDDLAARVGARIGVLVAPNFSLTVAFLTRLARLLGRFAMQDPAADVYLAEHHHARKKDAPSGTAHVLARALLESHPRKTRVVLAPPDRAVSPDELCVSVLRAGHTASSHVVGVDAPGETIELSHAARDLSPYARGALEAAAWIRTRTGVHTMADVAAQRLDPIFKTTEAAAQAAQEGSP
jgi:4-hydroxy-tetrahydrodipicolinate reductase